MRLSEVMVRILFCQWQDYQGDSIGRTSALPYPGACQAIQCDTLQCRFDPSCCSGLPSFGRSYASSKPAPTCQYMLDDTDIVRARSAVLLPPTSTGQLLLGHRKASILWGSRPPAIGFAGLGPPQPSRDPWTAGGHTAQRTFPIGMVFKLIESLE